MTKHVFFALSTKYGQNEKKILLTVFLVCTICVAWSHTSNDKEARCEMILAPFSSEQSFADRITKDLLTGIWRSEINPGFQLIRFDEHGWVKVLEDINHSTTFKTYSWLVFEIGELVYLRMDAGTRNDDHLYIVRQNCDGIILNHTFSDEMIKLDFIRSKDDDEVNTIETYLVGDWADPIDHTHLSLTLKENREFVYMDRQVIKTGKWEVFKDGLYLMLYPEEIDEPWIIPLKHIDFYHIDVIIAPSSLESRPKIISLEKQNIFN